MAQKTWLFQWLPVYTWVSDWGRKTYSILFIYPPFYLLMKQKLYNNLYSVANKPTYLSAKFKLNNKINLMYSQIWPPVYTPLFFVSSLIVFYRLPHVHDKSTSCLFTYLYPVLLILLKTFDVNSHLWYWYNWTEVYLHKLHQWGKRKIELLLLIFAKISLALALHPNLIFLTRVLSTKPVHLRSHVFSILLCLQYLI